MALGLGWNSALAAIYVTVIDKDFVTGIHKSDAKQRSQASLDVCVDSAGKWTKHPFFKTNKLTWPNHRQQNIQLKQFEGLKNYFYVFSALQEEQDVESLVQWILESSPGCLLLKLQMKIIPGAMNADDFWGILTF